MLSSGAFFSLSVNCPCRHLCTGGQWIGKAGRYDTTSPSAKEIADAVAQMLGVQSGLAKHDENEKKIMGGNF
jgi:hypothetical protein